ncbi:MAG: PEP-CTERM sorting domain-containing protein [Candidatus Acidiferrales bacterium]
MKLRYLLLVAVALIIPAGFANATPAGDPSVIINRSPLDATPFTGMFNVTLDDDGGANVTFENALNVDITQLTVQFEVPFPTGVNTCSSDIFSSCGVSFVSINDKTDFVTEDFVFSGGAITPDENFSFSAAGFTGANPNVLISSTPEPRTIVLLLTGGLLLIGFGRKW